MATAGRAPWADNFFESGMTPSKRDGIRGEGSGALRAFASKLVTLCAISCAMAVAGCVSNSAQREVRADPAPRCRTCRSTLATANSSAQPCAADTATSARLRVEGIRSEDRGS